MTGFVVQGHNWTITAAWVLRLKVFAQSVWNYRMRFSYFLYSSSFPIKMLATYAKMQKIEPGPIFFMMDEGFGGSV